MSDKQPDIVDRLRASTKACRAIDRSELLNEAAGLIEKLRRRLRLADAAVKSSKEAVTTAFLIGFEEGRVVDDDDE